MTANLWNLWQEARRLRGCLVDLKTTTSRRRHPVDEDPFEIDPFVSDEAKLLSSKTIRLMSDKTQVFTTPDIPLVRTRHTHVMEVVANSVVASDMLGLNTNLIRAASWGHDIGHVPFGHQGEAWMAETMSLPFCHEVMGVVIAQKIERKGRGLNLTHEVLNAMMSHSGTMSQHAETEEARLLSFTDKIAYIFADLNDIGVRARYPLPEEIVKLANEFGSNQRERGSTAISALVVESNEIGHVSFEHSEFARKFKELRTRMYKVYIHVTQQNVARMMEPMIEYLEMLGLFDPYLLLAIMTDREVTEVLAHFMKDARVFSKLALSEIVPHLQKIGPIDLCDADMDW
jgi:dGTPase